MKIFYLFILINLLFISNILSQPDWWNNRVLEGNLLSSTTEPETYYQTSVGNGYVSFVIGSNAIYVGGVFNGPALSIRTPSHRAQIPNFQNIVLGSGATLEYAGLDIQNATYTRVFSFTNNGQVSATQTFYAHQAIRNLLIQEITVDNSASNQPFNLELTSISNLTTPDMTVSNTTTSNAQYQTYVATILAPELQNGLMTSVAITNTFVPNQVTVGAGQVETFYFITSFFTNIETDDYVDSCNQVYQKSISIQDSLLMIHKDAWLQIWQSGIEVGGDLHLAQTVNTSLYYILSSARSDWPFSISPGSLSSDGYNGHVFWDLETWMFPTILLLQPGLARDCLLQYRLDNMAEAHLKALGYRNIYPNVTGLMYPWESAFTGAEACPTFAPTGILEQHITADISIAMRQYYHATGDLYWLDVTGGYKAVKGMAEFWSSRVVANSDGSFSINVIIPPDEYAVGVNNSVYTNVAVKLALEWAIEAASIVNDTSAPIDKWQNIADNLVILFDDTNQMHPEYLGYSGEMIKQADVVLLGYPLLLNMSEQVRKNDLEYYENKTDPNGPAMTFAMHTIAWLELGNQVNAQKQWQKAYANVNNSPFLVWTETPSGGTTNFITGAGGFLQGLVNGFGGLRIGQSSYSFYPQLPYGTNYLKIRSFNFYGSTFDVSWNSTLITLNMINYNFEINYSLYSEGLYNNIILTTYNSPILLPFGSKFSINISSKN